MKYDKYIALDGYCHYIYKITFMDTLQYYYGQHSVLSSEIMYDNYMGSGKKLNECYQISGYNNVKKDICCYAETFEELDILEEYYIGDLYETDSLCLNMVPGGKSAGMMQSRKLGGKTTSEKFKNMTDEERLIWRNILSPKVIKGLKRMTDDDRRKWISSVSKSLKKYYQTHDNPMKNHVYTQCTIEKMHNSHLGNRNSNFGNKWCYNEEFKISICVPELLWWDLIATGWISGRKMNFSYQLKNKGKQSSNISKNSKKSKIDKDIEKQNHSNEMYKKLKPMLEVYETEGFDSVVKKFDYKYSRNNLVQLFKKFIPYPEYIPNKHTRNTKSKQFKESYKGNWHPSDLENPDT